MGWKGSMHRENKRYANNFNWKLTMAESNWESKAQVETIRLKGLLRSEIQELD